MPRITRLVAASAILTPLYVAPVTMATSLTGMPEVKFNNTCAFGSCAPKAGWKCLHWFPDGTVTVDDSCDPNDFGCVEVQT